MTFYPKIQADSFVGVAVTGGTSGSEGGKLSALELLKRQNQDVIEDENIMMVINTKPRKMNVGLTN